MKRIVILCDGTWNTADAQHPTHVVRLARALAPACPGGHAQVPVYIQGVGTGRGVTAMSRLMDRVLGGSMGWGLMANVIDAYRHLVFLHEPDDEICIFGFSRGAFTARSLAGFIYKTGILDRDRLHLLPRAIERYRRKTEINSQASWDFRSNLSLRVVTTPEEAAYRDEAGMPAAPLVKLSYIGVWDTVGALGVPRDLPFAPLINRRKYQFHDTVLSPLVIRARHAVALDEQRSTFEPTLWSNVATPDAAPVTEGDPALRQQRYFAGDHSTVGGSAQQQDLASFTLDWVAQGAAEAGLHFDPDEMNRIRRAQNPFGPLHSADPEDRSPMQRLMYLFVKDRDGPARLGDLHRSVIWRWWRDPVPDGETPYRPASLSRVSDDLAALDPEARGPTRIG